MWEHNEHTLINSINFWQQEEICSISKQKLKFVRKFLNFLRFEGGCEKSENCDEHENQCLSLAHGQASSNCQTLQNSIYAIEAMVTQHTQTGTLTSSSSLFSVHLVKYVVYHRPKDVSNDQKWVNTCLPSEDLDKDVRHQNKAETDQCDHIWAIF